MLRNVLVTTACLLTAAVASAQQPTHKSSTIPASHPVPVVASQHARVPAAVVARKEAATTTRAQRKEERAEQKEARADSAQARTAHRAKAATKSKAAKSHRKGMKHDAKHEAKHDSSTARKGR